MSVDLIVIGLGDGPCARMIDAGSDGIDAYAHPNGDVMREATENTSADRTMKGFATSECVIHPRRTDLRWSLGDTVRI
jgi:hypothetical protein